MDKATNRGKVTKIAKNCSLKRRERGAKTVPASMTGSVSSPRGYLNWDKFLSSNFVLFSMYGLQLTTTKFLVFAYLDRQFILNTN